MAGLFGLFNYEKEGPGIRKDAPKKKTFVVFFETFFRNFFRFSFINIVYVLLCVPIITGGMASAGLTNITRNIARDKHSFGISDFFDTIRKNFKQSLAVGIINVIITVLLVFTIGFYYTSYAQTGKMLSLGGFAISASIAIIFLMMNFYIYTLMITFSYSVKTLYKNSFKFVFANIWRNIFCGIILILVYAIFIGFALLFTDIRVWLIEAIIAIVTLPAFRFLLIQFCTFGSIKKLIIDPYYAEHPDMDIEKRRNLGLDVPEDDISEFDDNQIETVSWE